LTAKAVRSFARLATSNQQPVTSNQATSNQQPVTLLLLTVTHKILALNKLRSILGVGSVMTMMF
jgi:hypothetical protein